MLYIFDWDGTLVNSVARIVTCLKAAARDLALPQLDDARYQEIIGLGLIEAVRQLYPSASPAMQESMCEAYSANFIALDDGPCPFFPGVEDTLSTLHAQGHLLAIATSKSRRGLDRVLDQLGWREYFHTTRCADETASKPHPLMLQEILLDLQRTPAEAVMIGDTSYDLEMAKRAGVRGIGVSYGAHPIQSLLPHEPIAIVDQFEAILAVI